MQPTKESWENFDPKAFEETVCAGGAEGVSSHAPEHMLGGGVMTFGGHGNSDKPDEENLADKPPVVKESWENFDMNTILQEQGQTQPAAQQPAQVAPAQPAPAANPAPQQAPVAPAQPTANPAPVANTQPVQTQPAATPAPAPATQPAQPVQQPINTQPAATAPQSQIVNNPQQVQESWEGFSMNEAHYDPADYWDEDPEWDVIPNGVKMVDIDREMCNRHRAARLNKYKKYSGSSKSSSPQESNYTPAVANPDERRAASKKFWADAKEGKLDIEAFHKAYDMELNEFLNLKYLFRDSGYLAGKSTYGTIKNACTDKPDSWACKALKKVWVIQYTIINESTDVDMKETNELTESTWEGITSEVIKEKLKECDMDDIVHQSEPDYEVGKVVEVPDCLDKDETVEVPDCLDKYDGSNDYFVPEQFGESTTWENVDMSFLKESIALPGGVLNSEPTEYEKELDKHNQARKNTKSPEVNIGNKDAGEIGVHDFDENGMPTGVKEKVKTDIKPTELKPNKAAVEVDQKKKWDD